MFSVPPYINTPNDYHVKNRVTPWTKKEKAKYLKRSNIDRKKLVADHQAREWAWKWTTVYVMDEK